MLIRLLPILLLASVAAYGQFGGNATRLRNKLIVSPLEPTDGQALIWVAANNRWEPGAGGGSPTTPSRNTFSAAATSVVVTHNYGFRATGQCAIGTTSSYVDLLVNSVTTTTSATTFNFDAASGDGFCEVLANGADGGATIELDNLGTTAINAALLFQATKSVGSTTAPPQYLHLYGAGTFGSHSFQLTGTPTGHRVITLPDATATLATLAGTEALTNKTISSFLSGTVTVSGAANVVTVQGTTATTLVVKAGSAQSTTSIFDIQNNAGTSLLKITEGGTITASGTTFKGGYIEAAATAYYSWLTRSLMTSPSDGVVMITNNAGTAASGTVQVSKVLGGSAVGDALTLQSTSGNGSGDTIVFKRGNNGATTAFTIQASGNVHSNHVLFGTDNTYDIGASGANRPRYLYTALDVLSGNDVRAATSGAFYWNSSTALQAPSNGVLRIRNVADSAGVSLDVATDGVMKVRNRANSADAAATWSYSKWFNTAEGTCDSSTRGELRMVQGGAGVADTFRVCSKDSSDVYNWTALY